jgi:hypothetical protein
MTTPDNDPCLIGFTLALRSTERDFLTVQAERARKSKANYKLGLPEVKPGRRWPADPAERRRSNSA